MKMKPCLLKDNSETTTQADPQNASYDGTCVRLVPFPFLLISFTIIFHSNVFPPKWSLVFPPFASRPSRNHYFFVFFFSMISILLICNKLEITTIDLDAHHHPLHCGLEQTRIETSGLGHSLVCSLIRSHRSLVCLLRTARFARALRCAHSFGRSLTLLTPSLVGK